MIFEFGVSLLLLIAVSDQAELCSNGNGTFACPYEKGHCCPSEEFCCPPDFLCLESDNKPICAPILSGKSYLNQPLRTINRKTNLISEDVVCPDRSTSCPQSTTCCRTSSGFACCPLEEAVCCSDGQHCCPHGTRCDVARSMCLKVVTLPATLPNPVLIKPGLPRLSERVNLSMVPAIWQFFDTRQLCPGNQTECTEKATCCKLVDGQYGCCSLPQATCCSDGIHCCPHGTQCDEKAGKCTAVHLKLTSIDLKENPSNNCPNSTISCQPDQTCCPMEEAEVGCCPFQNAVCCSDHQHCCPGGTTCNLSKGTCDSVSVKSIAKISNPAGPAPKMECPDKTQCSDFSTCCKTPSGGYGCCRSANATCCSDKLSCCPNGYECVASASGGTIGCKKRNQLVDPLPIKKGDAQQRCADGSSCDSSETCCKLRSGRFGCCPFPNANCCSDQEHCCPNGYRCNTRSGTCEQTSNPLIRYAWRSKNGPMKKLSELPNLITCPDKSKCPFGSTCCRMNGTSFGCCMLGTNGVCCSDGYCCPEGSTCVNKSPGCLKLTPRRQYEPSTELISSLAPIEDAQVSAPVICPDSRHKCPPRSKCCPMPDGGYGCCRKRGGVCCADGKHCCNNGYRCDEQRKRCVRPQFSYIPELGSIRATPIPTAANDMETIVCPDKKHQCGANKTCCSDLKGGFKCCPQKNGVCCKDGKHCCGEGFVCDDVKKRCVKSKVDNMPKAPAWCPDHQHFCHPHYTCCHDGSRQTCCPLENAVCCAGVSTCCPHGKVCSADGQKCYSGNLNHFFSLIWDPAKASLKTQEPQVAKKISPSPPKQENKDSTPTQCGNGKEICPGEMSCCENPRLAGNYSCCPFKNAQCCSNGEHCCPEGSQCDLDTGRCLNRANKQVDLMLLTRIAKVVASDICDSTCGLIGFSCCHKSMTCCPGPDWDCCPFSSKEAICCEPGTVCSPDNRHCLSKYSNESFSLESSAPAVKPALEAVVTDTNRTCETCAELNLTCCSSGCCDKDSVCCPSACCPKGSTCLASGGCQSIENRLLTFEGASPIRVEDLTDQNLAINAKNLRDVMEVQSNVPAMEDPRLSSSVYRMIKSVRLNMCENSNFFCARDRECCSDEKDHYTCKPRGAICCGSGHCNSNGFCVYEDDPSKPHCSF